MLKILLTLLSICVVAQLNAQPNLNLDPAFGNNGVLLKAMNGSALSQTIVAQPDSKILVIGRTGTDGFVSRFLPDGRTDSTFGTNGTSSILFRHATGDYMQLVDVVKMPNRLLAAGFIHHGFADTTVLVALDTNGKIDSTFGTYGIRKIKFTTSAHEGCAKMLRLNDSTIVLVGQAINPVNFRMNILVSRLNGQGDPDTNFHSTGFHLVNHGAATDDFPKTMAADSNGNLFVAGNAQYQVGITDYADALVVKLRSNGAIDSSFGTNGRYRRNITSFSGLDFIDTWNAIALQGSKVILAGQTARGSQGEFNLSRIDSLGLVDNTFAYNGNFQMNFCFQNLGQSVVSHLQLMPDGHIIAGGFYNCGVASNARLFVGRFSKDGIEDVSVGSNGFIQLSSVQGGNDYPSGMTLAPNGSIYQCAQSMKRTNFDVDLVIACYKDTLIPASVGYATKDDAIRVFPTLVKAGDMISIESNKSLPTPSQLCLTDVSGKVLSRQSGGAFSTVSSFRLPASMVPGIYFLKVVNKDMTTTRKIVVE